jgi:Rad3-related DNA helicase
VRVLLHRPTYLEQVIERVGTDSIHDPDLRRIFAALVELGADAGVEALAHALDGDAVLELQALLEESAGLDHADEAVTGSLAALHERDLTSRLEEIDALMPLAADAEKDVLLREKQALAELLRSIGRNRRWPQFG